MELHENTEKQESALLVAVDTGNYDVEASLAELYELTKTAGAEPFGAMTQKRPAYETSTCVGSGMIQEIADICQKQEIDLLIFDCRIISNTNTEYREYYKRASNRQNDVDFRYFCSTCCFQRRQIAGRIGTAKIYASTSNWKRYRFISFGRRYWYQRSR